ncbi:hypothetical protein LVY65_12445 [Sphingomonas sp. G124]|uniref:Uncharacterized protein n=1 Tax=Sphingomonas cremea TaxID=2904799 RepID=A0A9X1QLF7_9SPHN|nr:hypothetical protein [Sphingomonas cremea]MCF2515866.1 hypothetical protein [Sphingomonas cremea]
MARPLSTGKKSVNLATPEVRVSKIRCDPPPVVKEKIVLDPDERDQWNVVVGVLAFTLAIFVIILAVSSYTDHSPRQYTVQV